MQETEWADSQDDFRQGDIIRIEEGSDQMRQSNLGAIINADCDLVHGKLDGVIAYLPIYPFHTYLARFWAPNYIAKLRRSHLQHMREIYELDDQEAEDLLRWLSATTPEDINDRLSEACKTKLKRKKETADILRKLTVLADLTDPNRDPLALFSCLCRQDKAPEQFARKRIQLAYASMGDGHFFISEIVGNGGIGFVIRMRRIHTIDAARCFPSRSSCLSSTDGDKSTAVRVARLAAPFRFKFAQMFAHQFSRIGLPDEVSALSGLAIDDVVHQVLEHST